MCVIKNTSVLRDSVVCVKTLLFKSLNWIFDDALVCIVLPNPIKGPTTAVQQERWTVKYVLKKW